MVPLCSPHRGRERRPRRLPSLRQLYRRQLHFQLGSHPRTGVAFTSLGSPDAVEYRLGLSEQAVLIDDRTAQSTPAPKEPA